MDAGDGGKLGLHGSSGPGFDPKQYYLWKNGQMHNGLVVVNWMLVDQVGFGLRFYFNCSPAVSLIVTCTWQGPGDGVRPEQSAGQLLLVRSYIVQIDF